MPVPVEKPNRRGFFKLLGGLAAIGTAMGVSSALLAPIKARVVEKITFWRFEWKVMPEIMAKKAFADAKKNEVWAGEITLAQNEDGTLRQVNGVHDSVTRISQETILGECFTSIKITPKVKA